MSRVLIITPGADPHTFLMRAALRAHGVEPVMFFATDLPHRSRETIRFDGGGRRLEVRTPHADLGATPFDAVWMWRTGLSIAETAIDPADRDFAARQCEEMREAVLDALPQTGFWVNPLEAARRSLLKPRQHAVAAEVGLKMIPTLYSNDPVEIRKFLAECGGTLVYKRLRSDRAQWIEGERTYHSYTSAFTARDLPDDDVLAAVPGIYQPIIPKAYDLRVTVIGDRLFPVRIHSQRTNGGRLDYRLAYGEGVTMEECSLPRATEDRVRELMRAMGLVYGAVDFIQTPEGELLFLENNQMGQFLFVEMRTGAPLFDAFAQMLAQGRPDYRWSRARAKVRLDDAFRARVSSEISAYLEAGGRAPVAEAVQ